MPKLVILALPRTMTRTVLRGFAQHPEIESARHEYRGELPDPDIDLVLCNEHKRWMDRFPKLGVRRENYAAGALSALTMGYKFPADAYELPESILVEQMQWRRRAEAALMAHCDEVVTLEDITGGLRLRGFRRGSLSNCVGWLTSPCNETSTVRVSREPGRRCQTRTGSRGI